MPENKCPPRPHSSLARVHAKLPPFSSARKCKTRLAFKVSLMKRDSLELLRPRVLREGDARAGFKGTRRLHGRLRYRRVNPLAA